MMTESETPSPEYPSPRSGDFRRGDLVRQVDATGRISPIAVITRIDRHRARYRLVDDQSTRTARVRELFPVVCDRCPDRAVAYKPTIATAHPRCARHAARTDGTVIWPGPEKAGESW